MASELQVLRPAPGILAFYEGRQTGHRFAPEPNWVDAGALELGIASYAIVAGERALVYDTHTWPDRGRRIREILEGEGVSDFTVVLSHWHLDHVAGNTAFDDCEIVSSARTAEVLSRDRGRIESGELEGPPGIDPLVLPTRTYEGAERMRVGEDEVELIHVNVHSDDATVLWLQERRLLLCGDTMEDTVTYVDEPWGLDEHLEGLERLEDLGPERILPNHGDPEVIAGGGYAPAFNAATRDYVRKLQRCVDDPVLREMPLRELLVESLESGAIRYFEPYEKVHRDNVATVRRHAAATG